MWTRRNPIRAKACVEISDALKLEEESRAVLVKKNLYRLVVRANQPPNGAAGGAPYIDQIDLFVFPDILMGPLKSPSPVPGQPQHADPSHSGETSNGPESRGRKLETGQRQGQGKWGQLTDDDLDVHQRPTRPARKIQQRYGLAVPGPQGRG
jgi:hypothetical protein